VSTSRIACLSMITLVSLCWPVAGDTIELGKFRALLKTGERIEGHSGILTEDSLTGTTRDGNSASIPIQSIQVIDRSVGTQGTTLGLVGGGLGFAYVIVDLLEADSTTRFGAREFEYEDRDILDLMEYTIGGALIGIAVGSCIEKWQKVPVGGSISYLPERREIRFQLSLAF